MKEYLLNSPADYKLMSQTGVKQYSYPLNSTHNAIWDSNISPEGRLYYALASEICTSEYVHLCEYDYDTNTVSECFKVEDVILPSDRTIRASKFHSSINFMPNGKMVMTTHTTDKAPAHPTWMPEAYYHHIWEGYAGSNIVVYDPATKTAENLGCPVPRETIYGAIYEPAHNALFFTGMFRGHLYRYSFDEKRVQDLGRMSEHYSFRLTLGPDGNIYGASKSGYFYKVDTETLAITDLMFKPKHHAQAYTRDFTNISIGRTGPDGKIYFAIMYSRDFICLDPATGEVKEVGEYMPFAHQYCRGQNRHGVFGMDFDSEGVLWYVVSSRNCGSEYLEYGCPNGLFRWDITRGGKPEYMGIVGTKDRVGSWMSELCITEDDIMYVVGSNHGIDGPDITAVDLKEYRKTMYDFGKEPVTDPYYDKDDAYTVEVGQKMKDLEDIGGANPFTVPLKANEPVLLWRALAPNHIKDSEVKGLAWLDNDTLVGLCGDKQDYVFTVVDGVLKEIIPAQNADADLLKVVTCAANQLKADYDNAGLPNYPGRQYKAVATATTQLNDGRIAVGTADGMFAIASEKGVFGLGPAANNGPVRSLCTAPDGTVYGVAGDVEDLGVLFSYDDVNGLRWMGHAQQDSEVNPSFNLTLMTAVSVSPDGKKLAVGCADRIGTVVIFDL